MHQCFVNQNAHQTVNMVVFFVKSNENNLPKRESTRANVQSCPYNEM